LRTRLMRFAAFILKRPTIIGSIMPRRSLR